MQLNDEVRPWEYLCLRQFSDTNFEKGNQQTSSEPIESSNPRVRVVDYASNMKVFTYIL